LKSSKPFGNKTANKFNIGDLVSWSVWIHEPDGTITRAVKQGILTNIIQKFLGEREVTFACVLPMKSKFPIEMVITNIRKIETI